MTTEYLSGRLNGLKYSKTSSTALDKHEKKWNDEFYFNKTKMLTTTGNNHKFSIKEMIPIKKLQD